MLAVLKLNLYRDKLVDLRAMFTRPEAYDIQVTPLFGQPNRWSEQARLRRKRPFLVNGVWWRRYERFPISVKFPWRGLPY